MLSMKTVASPVDETSMVIESIDDVEMQQAVAATLAAAGLSFEDLRRQAATSHFVSERARRAWFVVSPLLASR